jgi:5-methylcytosine-specific restriction enzyme subunit McrC
LKTTVHHICEYGTIRCLDDYEGENSLDELYLSRDHFDTLYEYISQNQDDSIDAERPFSLTAKGSRRQIKVKNYVGVVETNNGLTLEILPKIHLNTKNSIDELQLTKGIFLKMLKHLKNSPFVNISNAHLDAKKDFPILEVFINSFISETEKLFNRGIKHDYIQTTENVNYLRGKLLVGSNIKKNHSNNAKFYCEYSVYSSNIPQNRIIKSVLLKLLTITKSYSSYSSILKVLSHLEDTEHSINYKQDFINVRTGGRLFESYQTLMLWSQIFLENKSFTNFSGNSLNTAILFPMERLFEDYIAFLFSKFSNGFQIKLQDKSYYLVENHKGLGKFGLKPDIVVNDNLNSRKIIDTKWKLLDQHAERKNYNISQADMYQLYAYGKKYFLGVKEPKLLLLYPANTNFTTPLDKFIYEGDLKLEVLPFDFTKDEEDQILQILSR